MEATREIMYCKNISLAPQVTEPQEDKDQQADDDIVVNVCHTVTSDDAQRGPHCAKRGFPYGPGTDHMQQHRSGPEYRSTAGRYRTRPRK